MSVGLVSNIANKVNLRMIDLERRRAKRFNIGWAVTVKGVDTAGSPFNEATSLENLSSTGAYLFLKRPLAVGAKLEVSIKVPFKRENWMKYSAEVVRVEERPPTIGVAMKFSAARPSFLVK